MNIEQAKLVVTQKLNSFDIYDLITGSDFHKDFPEAFHDGEGNAERRKAFHDAMFWAREQEFLARSLYNPIDDLEVGDGITLCGYSDQSAYTIIKRTKKTITLQRDNAKLLNMDDLKFHIGGFSAHCSNQGAQEYDYTQDADGYCTQIRRRQTGAWKTTGQTSGAMRATVGRHEFYDYNF
tara:strand:- start:6323 stop:6862 length:540 start_codon:yes stop_codon:yes gene_type:complete